MTLARRNPFDRLRPPQRANPILGAMVMSSRTASSEPGMGGATQELRSGRIITTETGGYAVGAARDRSGRAVPTRRIVQQQATPMAALAERERLRGRVEPSNKEATLGWWRDPDVKRAPVESDLSDVYESRGAAMREGRRRNQKAIFDVRRGKDIRLHSTNVSSRQFG